MGSAGTLLTAGAAAADVLVPPARASLAMSETDFEQLQRWITALTCLWTMVTWWLTRIAARPLSAATAAGLAVAWGMIPILVQLQFEFALLERSLPSSPLRGLVPGRPPLGLIWPFWISMAALLYGLFLASQAPIRIDPEAARRTHTASGQRRRPMLHGVFSSLVLVLPLGPLAAVAHRLSIPVVPSSTQLVLLTLTAGVCLAAMIWLRLSLRSYPLPRLGRLTGVYYLGAAITLVTAQLALGGIPTLLAGALLLVSAISILIFLLVLFYVPGALEMQDEQSPALVYPKGPVALLLVGLPVFLAMVLLLLGTRSPLIDVLVQAPQRQLVLALPAITAIALIMTRRHQHGHSSRLGIILAGLLMGAAIAVGGYAIISFGPAVFAGWPPALALTLAVAAIALGAVGIAALLEARRVTIFVSAAAARLSRRARWSGVALTLAALLLPDLVSVQQLRNAAERAERTPDLAVLPLGEDISRPLLVAAYACLDLPPSIAPRTLPLAAAAVLGLPQAREARRMTRTAAAQLYFSETGTAYEQAADVPTGLLRMTPDVDRGALRVGNRRSALNAETLWTTATAERATWQITLRNDGLRTEEYRGLFRLMPDSAILGAHMTPAPVITNPELPSSSAAGGAGATTIAVHFGSLSEDNRDLWSSVPISFRLSDAQTPNVLTQRGAPGVLVQPVDGLVFLRLGSIPPGGERRLTVDVALADGAPDAPALTLLLDNAGSTAPSTEPTALAAMLDRALAASAPAEVVLDRSAGMTGALPSLMGPLRLSQGRLHLVSASGEALTPIPLAQDMASATPVSGGRSSLPALAQALTLAALEPDRDVLWITGPQPPLSAEDRLRLSAAMQQIKTTGREPVRLRVLIARPGPLHALTDRDSPLLGENVVVSLIAPDPAPAGQQSFAMAAADLSEESRTTGQTRPQAEARPEILRGDATLQARPPMVHATPEPSPPVSALMPAPPPPVAAIAPPSSAAVPPQTGRSRSAAAHLPAPMPEQRVRPPENADSPIGLPGMAVSATLLEAEDGAAATDDEAVPTEPADDAVSSLPLSPDRALVIRGGLADHQIQPLTTAVPMACPRPLVRQQPQAPQTDRLEARIVIWIAWLFAGLTALLRTVQVLMRGWHTHMRRPRASRSRSA